MIAKNIKPYSWDKEPNPKSFTPLEKYCGEPCLSDSVKHCEKLSDFFNYFINDKMVQMIIDSTNSKLALFSIDKEFIYKNYLQPLNSIEIKCYFGLLILFGVLQKRDVDIYEIWKEDGIHHCNYATASMPRHRFEVISRCISYDEIESREIRKQTDPKFYKMREYFEIWRENLRSSYVPGPDLCVDETMLIYLFYFLICIINIRKFILKKVWV